MTVISWAQPKNKDNGFDCGQKWHEAAKVTVRQDDLRAGS